MLVVYCIMLCFSLPCCITTLQCAMVVNSMLEVNLSVIRLSFLC